MSGLGLGPRFYPTLSQNVKSQIILLVYRVTEEDGSGYNRAVREVHKSKVEGVIQNEE